MEIHYLQNGAGTCAIVNCPAVNKSKLMDCGSSLGNNDTNFPYTESEIGLRLQTIIGDRELSAVFSHGDIDHYNYVPKALSGVQLSKIFLGEFSTYYVLADFDDWLVAQGAVGAHIHKDLPINYVSDEADGEDHLDCGNASVHILTNRAGANLRPRRSNRNRNSMVTLVEYDDFRAIFSGVAERKTEQLIIDNFENMSAKVVTGSHHGARFHGSNHQDWIDKIKAKAVIYTSGYEYEHPKCNATQRFRAYLADVTSHDFTCDVTRNKRPAHTTKAQYGTEVLGDIKITTSGISPFRVECALSECTSEISH